MTLTVATVIPTYNSNPVFLCETLRSVRAQTRLPDEVIVVDDGSDHMPELPDLDLPLRVLRRQHEGISLARNAGVIAAKADVVHVLDHDDRLRPGFYEALMPIMESGADVAYSTLVYIDGAGSSRPGQYPDSSFRPPREWLPELLRANQIGSPAALFRRTIWERVGGFADYHFAQDWRFWLDSAKHGAEIRYLPEPLVEYRQHAGQTTDVSRTLEIKLECAAMLAQTSVPARYWWRKQDAIARWWLEAVRVAPSTGARALYLGRGGWRRPRTAIAAARGRWG